MDAPDPIIPPDLAAAVRRASPSPTLTDADRQRLDAFVLAEARRALRPRRRSTASLLIRIGLPMTAAAAIAVLLWSPWSSLNTAPTTLALDPAKPEGVTILDAFTLARLLQQRDRSPSTPISPTWDLTADGRVDHLDVEALARRAVRLGGAT